MSLGKEGKQMYRLDVDFPPYALQYVPSRVTEFTAWASGRCNLRCKYCLRKGTKILMADFTWKPIEEVRVGDYVVGIEFPKERNKHIRLIKTRVVAVISRKDVVYKVVTDKGTLYITDNHAILNKSKRWVAINPAKTTEVKAYKLGEGTLLKFISSPVERKPFTVDYMKGYLFGVFRGDGCFVEKKYIAEPDKPYLKKYGYKHPVRRVTRFYRLAMKDVEVLKRVTEFLEKLGVRYTIGIHKYRYAGEVRFLPKVSIYRKDGIKTILSPTVSQLNNDVLIEDNEFTSKIALTANGELSTEFLRGFVAGIFDAEGSISNVIRIHNTDENILQLIEVALKKFGFKCTRERMGIRIIGGLKEIIRFVALFNPAKIRVVENIYKIAPRGVAKVLKIEKVGEETVYNLQTESENYIAEGFIVHNCFVYRIYPQQPSSDMSEDVVESLIDFALKWGSRPVRIWWFGGEPLVAWDKVIVYAVEYAKAKGLRIGWNGDIHFGMTTNATLLDEEKVKFMAKYQFGILVSIDGVKEKHDMFRVYANGRGSWDDAWKGLQLVRKYLNSNPSIRWSVGTSTLKGLAEDVKWFVKQGLTNLAIDWVYEIEWNDDDIELLRKEMIKLRSYLLEWFRRGIPVMLKPLRDGISPATSPMRLGWQSRCGLGQGSVGVDIDGTIYPCHRFVSTHDKKLAIGHVKEGWYWDKRIEWIREWRKYPPYSEKGLEDCEKCIYRASCHGGCLAVNYDLFGDVHVVPESFCRIMRVLAEVFLPLHHLLVLEGNETYKRIYLSSGENFLRR